MVDASFPSWRYGPKPDIVKNVPKIQQGDYLALTLDPESDLDLTGKGTQKPLLSGTIHPFHKSHTTVLGHFHEEFRSLLTRQSVRLAALFVLINCFVIACLASWSSSTNSLALRAYNYITMFELLGLLTYMASAWSLLQDQRTKPNSHNTYTLGFERVQVLAVFSSVVVAQLGAVFIMKEAIERLIEQPEVHAGRLLPGALLAFSFRIAVNYFVDNHAFKSICEGTHGSVWPRVCGNMFASSSWMQEHFADMSRGICGIVPMLESVLLPRVNPFFLISFTAGCAVLLVDVLLQLNSYYVADTMAALAIAIFIFATMWPIMVCSGRVLLHTTPPHVLGQLDKLLSEAQTLDGVLEIRSEKFYTLSMGLAGKKGGKSRMTLAGSLQVRVRRDADEQMVLAHVTNRLSQLVPLLTVQVVKDDWISGQATHGGIAVKMPHMVSPQSTQGFSSPAYISGFNKPAAAVAPYLQTPPRRAGGLPAGAASNIGLGIDVDSAKNERKDDFSFTSPAKSMSSTVTSLIKPRSSQTDIARMYKAAGFSTLPSGSSPSFGFSSGSFSHLKGSYPSQGPALGRLSHGLVSKTESKN